jgi:hypothetical protein
MSVPQPTFTVEYKGPFVASSQLAHGDSGTITFRKAGAEDVEASYSGNWRLGKSHGYGVAQLLENGGKYDGTWNRNHMYGEGVYHFGNGDVYDGEWRFSMFHGQGIYAWKESGDEYSGQFYMGKREGQGSYIHKKTGITYKGSWSGDLRHGLGEEIYANQDRYEGYWVAGKKHGPGYYYQHMDNVDKKKKEERALISKSNDIYIIYEQVYDKGKKLQDKELLPNEAVKDLTSMAPAEILQKLNADQQFVAIDMNNIFIRYLLYGQEVFPDYNSDITLDKAFVLFEKLTALKKLSEKLEKLRIATKDLTLKRQTLLEKAQKLEAVKRDGTKQDMGKALRELCNIDPPGESMLEDIFRMKLSVQISKLNEQMTALDKMIENEVSQSGFNVSDKDEWNEQMQQQLDNISGLIKTQSEKIVKIEKQLLDDDAGDALDYDNNKAIIDFSLSPDFAKVVNLVCQFLQLVQHQTRVNAKMYPDSKRKDVKKDMEDIISQLKKNNTRVKNIDVGQVIQRMEAWMFIIEQNK